MSRSRPFRTIALIGCLALVLAMLPLFAMQASAAEWDRIAEGGITNANNEFLIPGVPFQGRLTVGAIPEPAWGFELSPVSCYNYNGNDFTRIGHDGFGNANVSGLIPTGSYNGDLFIGTHNDDDGCSLFRWNGTGNPILVPGTENGWGEGVDNESAIPLGVFNNRLLVGVQNFAGAPDGGFRMYEYDGAVWTQVVGPDAGAIADGGLGDPDNTTPVMLLGETLRFQDRMILMVANANAGEGMSVWAYDGSSFERLGKAGDPGIWSTDFKYGTGTASPLDGVLYVGAFDSTDTVGGEIWSYDGSDWGLVVDAGIDDTDNDGLIPLARGEDLFAGTWNDTDGCQVFQMDDAGGFDAISDKNFGKDPAVTLNEAAVLKTWQGKLYATTLNNVTSSEIYTTATPPSIDRLVPSSGPYGATVRVEGHDFLESQDGSTVTFAGAQARVASWSDTEIEAIVPDAATSGPVQVTNSNGASNEVPFDVTLNDRWYFAEGTTRDNVNDGTYQEWICIQNPNEATANIDLTYMLEDGTTQVQTTAVDPQSRKTVSVNDFLGPDQDVSTMVESDQLILAERPMYFNYRNKWTGGHDVMGVTAPRDTFYFAEGTTRDNVNDGSYEEWLCIQNPGDQQANVDITYMLGTGQTIEKSYPVLPTSRETVEVNMDVPVDNDVSVLMESDQPIVAERPLYFNYRNKWTGGHDVVGASGSDTEFYFAEGSTRRNDTDGYFEEWITIQNPNQNEANVEITYWTTAGQEIVVPLKVDPTSRYTEDAWLDLGDNVDASFRVTSDLPILVERPMYFNYHNAWQGGHDVMGCAAPKETFYFAEGTTLSATVTIFDTYVAVLNPGTADAEVTFTYMIEGEPNLTYETTVAPASRFTQKVNDVIGPNKNLSIQIDCTNGQSIVAERPMYFLYQGWCTGGHDTLGYGLTRALGVSE